MTSELYDLDLSLSNFQVTTRVACCACVPPGQAWQPHISLSARRFLATTGQDQR